MNALMFVLLIFVFFAFSAWRGYARARQLYMLVDHGLSTNGRVLTTVRFPRGPKRFRLIYEYDTPERTRKNSSFVSRERFALLHEGQSLAVRYLPERPEISAPEFVVDEMRAARERLSHRP